MPKQRTRFLILAAFLVFFAMQLPAHARAADAPDWQNKDCTKRLAANQDAETATAQALATNTANFYAYMPPIDLATYNCLKQIDDIMNQLQGISNLGLGVILDSIINAAITNIIGQVCNVITGTLGGVEKLIYSQINRFCIPLPNIGLNLHAPTLPTGPTCTGTPLLHLTPLPATTTNGPSLWQLWGLGGQQGTTPKPVTP